MPRRAAAGLAAAAVILLALPASAGAQAGVSYLIPPGNPFAAQPGAAPEIWAYGFRNPYRFSFDGQTGDMVIGDVGSSSLGGGDEEVNVIRAGQSGLNFGWPCREGNEAGPQPCNAAGAVGPVYSYPTQSGDAITGGYVVREGAGLPDLTGRYLFSDYSGGEITAIELDGSPADIQTGVSGNFISFGADAAGRLYVTDGGGPVLRLVDGNPLATQEIGSFAFPTHVTAAPGDGSRLFVVELAGRIRVVANGQTLQTPFLELASQVSTGGSTGAERGMFALAFPSDYATSRRFYVCYTDGGGDVRVDEFKVSDDPNRADPASQRTVLTVEHSSASNHNGGQLQFGPDGYLYVSIGDGGLQGDNERDAQNLGNHLGKILRIDPDAAPGPALPADTDPPGLTASARKRQRMLRLRGVVAQAGCDEACTVTLSGRLRVGRRSFRLKPAARTAQAADDRVRLKAGLTRKARRALRRALRRGRRPRARLSVRARDLAGNRSGVARRVVRARL